MKSLRLHNIGDVRLHEEEKPTPQAGEVLLRSYLRGNMRLGHSLVCGWYHWHHYI